MKTCRTCIYARPAEIAGSSVGARAYCHLEPPKILALPQVVAPLGKQSRVIQGGEQQMQILPVSARPLILFSDQACDGYDDYRMDDDGNEITDHPEKAWRESTEVKREIKAAN